MPENCYPINSCQIFKVGLALPVAILASLLVVAVGPAFAKDLSPVDTYRTLSDSFVAIADQVSKGVVFVKVEKQVRQSPGPLQRRPGMSQRDFFERFFEFRPPGQPGVPRGAQPPQTRVQIGQGSGFLITADGYLVTNHHVIVQADKIKVVLTDGREFSARIVGSDPQTDIALLKIEGENFSPVTLGDSDGVKVGEWVLAIGSPFGLSHSVTAGIISARGRGNIHIGDIDYADFIQTDAAINPGNSGGPLVNLDGEVVAMNAAILSRSGGYQGIGFAIPINMVKFIRDQLLDHGSITRGFLGIRIQNVTPEIAEWFKVPEGQGILVAEVAKDTPAEAGGLLRDDIIVELEGQPVSETGSFRSRISTTPSGSSVNLSILRDGKRITKIVTIGGRAAEVLASASRPGGGARLGIKIQNLTIELAERFGYGGKNGVLVVEVRPGSDAAALGILRGNLIEEINRKRVKNVQEFNEILSEAASAKSLLLLVTDGQGSRYVALKRG